MEYYETDESDMDELLDPHAKSLIQEDLRAESGNKWKQEKSIRMMMTSVLQKEIIWIQEMKIRVLGKLDKAFQHFGKFDPTTKKNKMQWKIMRYGKIMSPQINTSFIRISTQLENKMW